MAVYKSCPRPPSKQQIFQFIQAEETENEVDLGLEPNHLPNVKWLLLCLSTLNPNHEIFDRGYLPARRVGNVNVIAAPLIQNPGGLYDNVPRFNADGKGRSGRGGGLTKQQQLEYKMQVERAKIAKNEERVRNLQQQLERQNQLDEEDSVSHRRLLALENQLNQQRQESQALSQIVREYQEFRQSEEFELFQIFMRQRRQENPEAFGSGGIHDAVMSEGNHTDPA